MIVFGFAFLLGGLAVFVLMGLWVDRLKHSNDWLRHENRILWHDLKRHQHQCQYQAELLESRTWPETTKERM